MKNMKKIIFSEEDQRQLQERGCCQSDIFEQISMFKKGGAQAKLKRPCRLGDGIMTISANDRQHYLDLHAGAERQGRLLKFVPASGAASRMFKIWQKIYHDYPQTDLPQLKKLISPGDYCQLQQLITDLDQFAFYEHLAQVMAAAGMDLEQERRQQRYDKILAMLLTPAGLNYDALPKALIPFHRYRDHIRTPLEEHLEEAAAYAKSPKGCRLHFTIPDGEKPRFVALLAEILPRVQQRTQVEFQIEFSSQKLASETIAVDLDNCPLRDADGRLLFRPGGHGALLDNLDELNADIVLIKNIDNVVTDAHKGPTHLYKKLLTGLLVSLQQRIFDYLHLLEQPEKAVARLDEIAEFAGNSLNIALAPAFARAAPSEKIATLCERLDRPLRVCGMVPNQDEPGGGPFWVEDNAGTVTPQIIEKAQIDLEDEQQRAILAAATHFNPVDLVCGIGDYRGNGFNLYSFVDHQAVFIANKTHQGRPIKALELPGLWNGGMAYWNTVLVEVPLTTFSPVKVVTDLLREMHRCDS